MIESGEKKEEYREITNYWVSRLIHRCFQKFKRFDAVRFSYGYTRRTMIYKIERISIGKGKTEWESQDKGRKKEKMQRTRMLKNIFKDVRNIDSSRFINVYDLEGNYEATYAGSVQTAKALGVKYQTVLIQLKKKGTVGGRQIRETEIAWINGMPCINKRKIEPARKREDSNPGQPVSVYDLDGDYIETYASIRECAEKLGINSGTICRAMRNAGRGEGTQQANGYMFRKAKKLEEWSKEKWDRRKIKPYTGRNRMKYRWKEYESHNRKSKQTE